MASKKKDKKEKLLDKQGTVLRPDVDEITFRDYMQEELFS